MLYDASTSDDVFEKAIEQKFNFGQGKEFLEAYKLASNYYHRFGSFYKGTWDATAYAEAFAGFEAYGAKHITLNMLSQADVLDSINYQSIKDYLNSSGKLSKQINPLQLAQICESEAVKVFAIVEEIRSKNKGNTLLDCELTDMETLAFLHNYLACRIKAAVLFAQYKISKDSRLEKETLGLLNKSKEIWQEVTNSAEKYNQIKIPYMFNDNFSYRTYLDSIDSEARSLFLK